MQGSWPAWGICVVFIASYDETVATSKALVRETRTRHDSRLKNEGTETLTPYYSSRPDAPIGGPYSCVSIRSSRAGLECERKWSAPRTGRLPHEACPTNIRGAKPHGRALPALPHECRLPHDSGFCPTIPSSTPADVRFRSL